MCEAELRYSELCTLSANVATVSTPFAADAIAWVGGSVVGSVQKLQGLCTKVQREDYFQHGLAALSDPDVIAEDTIAHALARET